MSGIAAALRFDGGPALSGLVETMTAAMDFRGPDGIHHWTDGAAAIGQCLLCTTAESLAETLPLVGEDSRLALVMDGRLDNWEELRGELLAKGVRLRGRTDSELVLRAYETWGADCAARLDGDFVFVIWDQQRREAFCVRDQTGAKPLHYHWNGQRLLIASDLHAIYAAAPEARAPNEGMLAEILAGEWYARDETLWRGIMKLTPAHQMRGATQNRCLCV